MPKGPMWDGRRIAGKRGVSTTGALIGARDRHQHTESRQVWNRAFTSASVKRYEPIVIRRAAQLVEELKKRCIASAKGKQEAHVDMSRWMSYFSFDFMGDFVFGGAFELMRDGDEHGLIHTLESGLFLPSLTQHIPWCLDLFIYMPFLGRQMKSLGGLAYRQVQKRLKGGSVNDDLFYHLNDEAHVNSSGPPPLPVLITNSVTAVIAGSDTTASTLSNIVYLLSRYPSCLSRLRAEVDTAFPPGKAEPTESVKLAQMEYLNAVINEALRLYPPVASCLQRAPTKGSGGQMLGTSLFVSEDTAVYAPPYAYHRDPRYFFPDPDRFWPERWLNETRKDKGVVLNVNAFMPFSIGPANCVGKPLALLELRIVISYMVQNFDMRFADGYREDQWEDDLRDYFVTQRGSLPIVLTVRMPPA
ncbi:cytochrome P450 [Wolfiporia cocos MD-104 SS10]|uniref:Cytochrome P450 n=1 Tax=Wolfiporia cocos (strain MD-104) TaxID=742152 RepID=A0A2H3JXN6_WOLCO|nr:cytochrome P450 [Wolfiporia cocos MD-104 SS10]